MGDMETSLEKEVETKSRRILDWSFAWTRTNEEAGRVLAWQALGGSWIQCVDSWRKRLIHDCALEFMAVI